MMAVALVGTTCLPGGSRPRLFSGSPSRFYASSPTYLRVSCFSSPSEPVSSFESSSLPLENLAFNFQLIYVQSFILFFLLSFVCVGLLAQMEATNLKPRSEYKPGFFDDLFLDVFRSKMVQETGWDSEKPGYGGLIEIANRLIIGRTNSEAKEASIRILRSLFPQWLLELYQILVAPLAGGKVAAVMVARVTALTCKWLMGPCEVNSVILPDGTTSMTGVFVERCKYLEESKCVGICINTCKLPTQAFFKDYMGVDLLMEPNFSDYSCQFKFGILPPEPENDTTLKEPCLDICPNASRRRESNRSSRKCPKA